MKRFLVNCLWVSASSMTVLAQTPHAPYAPFTARQAELGKELAAKSLEIRRQITDGSAPAEPFKIIGSLYFVGDANGEVFLLTSPKGHIMMGAGAANSTESIQKNIESLGFKMTDVKAILLNHNHGDQSGGAAYMKEKTGAAVMAGFGEIPYMEHGMFNPPAIPVPAATDARGGRGGGPPRYPPVKVDRALFDGDVVKVGSLSFTAYLMPGHSPSSTSFLYTVRDAGRDYRVFEFCCWEYPDDLSRGAYITEASVRHNLETFRKVLPVDIYLETGAYGWSGTLNQASYLTITQRMVNLRTNNKLWVNRDI